MLSNNQTSTSISETVLWSYISQIGSAIRVAHVAGLAIRLVDSTKILLTGKNRYVLFLFALDIFRQTDMVT